MSETEPFDFRSIRLRPMGNGSPLLVAECLHPTCGLVMTFSTYRMDVIIETCRDHACRRLCACAESERLSA
jgi:hypothetical protein